jgi:VIT1/CCC1 family predicted Fe2+/Mn2+ transporter
VHAQKHLALGSRGPLAKTQLGCAVFLESVAGAIVSGACSFGGAMFPMLFAMIRPGTMWLSLGTPIASLGLLGGFLGRSANGNALLWAIGLMCIGAVLTPVGLEVRIM